MFKKGLNNIAVFSMFFLFISCNLSGRRTVAEVGNLKITLNQLISRMQMERGKFDPVILSERPNFEMFKKHALDTIIEETLLLNEAKRLGITVSKKEEDAINKMYAGTPVLSDGESSISDRGIDPEEWTENQKKRVIIQKLIEQEVLDKIPVSEQKIEAYYKNHSQNFNVPPQYHARQILVDTREIAQEVKTKLAAGGSFEELAGQYSISPDAKHGGDLGFFDANLYPEAFVRICEKLSPGGISDIIETDYGFQLFELLEKRPARRVALEEARPGIIQALKEEASADLYDEWQKKLEQDTKVTINETILKEASLK